MDPLVHLNFFRTNLIGKKKHFTVLNRTLSFSEQFVGFLIAAIYCLNRLCNVSLNLLYLTVLILHLANLINRENNHCVQFNAIGVIPSNLREHPRDAFLFPPKGVVCDLMQITVGLEPYGSSKTPLMCGHTLFCLWAEGQDVVPRHMRHLILLCICNLLILQTLSIFLLGQLSF